MATQRELLDELLAMLHHQAKLPRPDDARHAAVAKAKVYREVANMLAVALEAPEDDVTVADMSVTVRWPAGKGLMQAAVFARDDAPEPETMTRLDRGILRTLLQHALDKVDGRA